MEIRKKDHRFLDKPVLGYVILAVFAELIQSFGSIIDDPIAKALPGYGTSITVSAFGREVTQSAASGLGTAVFALLALFIFKRWFKPEFKGCLRREFFLKGILMLAAVELVHYAGSIVSICILGAGNVLVAFLRALAPGFGEEVAFRGLGVANYMRTVKDEKKITEILLLSSLTFGFLHVFNAFSGADPVISVLQGLYACGIGLLFGAVFLRTGNLWVTIIAHTLTDFLEFIRADLNASGGVMTGMTAGDWITIVAGIAAGVVGVYLCRKEKRPEIMSVWRERWSKEGEAKETASAAG